MRTPVDTLGSGPTLAPPGLPPLRAGSWPARALAGAGLLAVSWYGLRSGAVQRADVRIGDSVRAAGTPALDQAVRYTTDLGSMYSVLGVAGVLAATGRRRAAADVLGVGGLAWNIAQYNKTRVRRQRPYESEGVRRLVRPPTGSSFPSGHAAVGAAMFTMLADHAPAVAGRRFLQGLGAYVAVSRIYVGVHYPTDVVGGAGLGLALGAVWRGPLAAANHMLVSKAFSTARRGSGPAVRRLRGLARAARSVGPAPGPADVS